MSQRAVSFVQERVWFLHQRDDAAGAALNAPPFVLRLRGRLDERALEAALTEIVRRHEALRTAFPARDGQPVAVVHPAAPVPLPVVDLSSSAIAGSEAEARRLAAEEARRPFDLAEPPLLRAALFRLSSDDHLLEVVLHHLAWDAWSTGVFFRELSLLYDAFLAGAASPLPELPVQYGDFAAEQRALVLEDRSGIGYWREALADAPTILELPTDKPRPAAVPFTAHACRFSLSPDLMAAVGRLARQTRSSVFMVLLAAYQALLGRYTGRDDVAVGTLWAGRNRPELEAMIGLFPNLVVLRTDLSGDPAFSKLVGRVRDSCFDAFVHQEVPFELILRELNVQRDPNRTPLIQIVFNFLQGVDPVPPRLREVSVESVYLPGFPAPPLYDDHLAFAWDLYLTLLQQPTGALGAQAYAGELYEPETVGRFVGHFETLLAAAVAEPGRRLSTLRLLGEDERRKLLVESSRGEPAASSRRCLHELFEEQARRTPDAPAVLAGEECLTYAQLDRRANQLARRLGGLGAGPEVRVGICADWSLELVVGLLGILKAGAAYVPLDPSFPPERLEFILSDAGAQILLMQQHLAERLRLARAGVVRLDADWPEFAAEPGDPPRVGVLPANLAYVIYTSGSTGQPKGVLVEHASVVNYLTWAAGAYGSGGSGAPLVSPPSVDLAVTSLWVPLVTGEPVVQVEAQDPVEAIEAAFDGRPEYSFAKLTPSQLEAANLVLAAEDLAALARTLVLGGEMLRGHQLEPWREHAPQVCVFNEYGPTEATVACAAYSFAAGEAKPGPIPIGRPIAGARLYVLDHDLEPTPIGVAGELFVGGPGVARGYLNRPGLTAEQFVPDPFGEPGKRLYRTGDLARFRGDGVLELLGRRDDQVKLRGYRVELGEIEATLARHPGVRRVVVAAEGSGDARKLVAYVTGPEPAPTTADLTAFLEQRLPAYMIPTRFVSMTHLPLTRSGKLDRAALRKLAEDAPSIGSASSEDSRTPEEEQLVSIWQALLSSAKVGLDDNFFALGGDSLKAVQMVARARAAGMAVEIGDPREAQTIRELASKAASRAGSAPTIGVPTR